MELATDRSVPSEARHVTVAAARLPGWLAGFAERHGALDVQSDARVVLLAAADGSRAWLEVTFPPLGDPAGDTDLLAHLVAHVQRERTVGVLLVRRGGYAAGVFEGASLVDSKVGSSYVQGTTKAGGWSQQRYARRRANQAGAAFAHAGDAAARVLLPALAGLDAVVTGGDREAIEATLADPRLAALSAKRVARILVVPDPRLTVLRATPEQFLALRIAIHP